MAVLAHCSGAQSIDLGPGASAGPIGSDSAMGAMNAPDAAAARDATPDVTTSLTCSNPDKPTLCGGKCADLLGSGKNCGRCGNECPKSMVCSAGICKSECEGMQTMCGESCVNLEKDSEHCGACGTACIKDTHCKGGLCR
jgi:Stigma-specific protein, Stig1